MGIEVLQSFLGQQNGLKITNCIKGHLGAISAWSLPLYPTATISLPRWLEHATLLLLLLLVPHLSVTLQLCCSTISGAWLLQVRAQVTVTSLKMQ